MRCPPPVCPFRSCGVFSLFAAGLVGAGGRVIAIEPSPMASAVAAANIESHARWRAARGASPPAPVEVLRAACGDVLGRITLTLYEHQTTLASIHPDHNAAQNAVAVSRGSVAACAPAALACARVRPLHAVPGPLCPAPAAPSSRRPHAFFIPPPGLH